jgi:hypothetical protein
MLLMDGMELDQPWVRLICFGLRTGVCGQHEERADASGAEAIDAQ